MPSRVPEDKIILAQMNRLQRDWHGALSDANRDAWRAYWIDHPPLDIALRTYVARDVNSWSEIKVEEHRVYAWSQIYGFYRFKRLAQLYPATFEQRDAIVLTVDSTGGALNIGCTYTPRATESAHLLVFASDSKTVPGPANRYNVRPLCSIETSASPTTRQFQTCYNFRFGHYALGPIDITCALVDDNNSLHPSPVCETFTISAS